MSWSEDRRRLLRAGAALPVLLLAGCFRPMLAEGSAARGLRGRIALPQVQGRFGYYLYQALEDRLGTPQDPLWQLEIDTRISEDDLAITPDAAITRKSLTAAADYRLLPVAGGTPVLSDRAISQSGYNATGSLYATRVVARDIERRLALDLGERIARHLLAEAPRLVAP